MPMALSREKRQAIDTKALRRTKEVKKNNRKGAKTAKVLTPKWLNICSPRPLGRGLQSPKKKSPFRGEMCFVVGELNSKTSQENKSGATLNTNNGGKIGVTSKN